MQDHELDCSKRCQNKCNDWFLGYVSEYLNPQKTVPIAFTLKQPFTDTFETTAFVMYVMCGVINNEIFIFFKLLTKLFWKEATALYCIIFCLNLLLKYLNNKYTLTNKTATHSNWNTTS